MKICYILEKFYPFIGGAEKLSSDIALEMISKKHQIRVITTKLPNTNKKENISNVKIYRYKWIQIYGHPIPRYRDLLPHIKWADIVHTATFTTAPKTLKIAEKLHKPCIITVYEYYNNKWAWFENPILASFLKLYERNVINKNYNFWHSISESTTKDLIANGINKSKIITIYPGVEIQNKLLFDIDINQIFNINKNKFVFLYFGRIGKIKGVDVLLKAIKISDRSLNNEVKFCFLVDNPNYIQGKAHKLNIDHRISVLKHVKKTILYRCIQTTDCVIVPSITEGFGYSVAETCYLKTPIIASNTSSIPEIISGQYLLFENRNPNDLSKKIYMALKNQYLRSRTKKFPLKNMTTQIENMYKRCL